MPTNHVLFHIVFVFHPENRSEKCLYTQFGGFCGKFNPFNKLFLENCVTLWHKINDGKTKKFSQPGRMHAWKFGTKWILFAQCYHFFISRSLISICLSLIQVDWLVLAECAPAVFSLLLFCCCCCHCLSLYLDLSEKKERSLNTFIQTYICYCVLSRIFSFFLSFCLFQFRSIECMSRAKSI